jgi:hypothetical protein
VTNVASSKTEPLGIVESTGTRIAAIPSLFMAQLAERLGPQNPGKQDQTITFPALPTKTEGDADFNPGATASSGLPVSYESSNTSVATIVAGQIQVTGAGTSTITASQAGDANYNPAANVSRTLTVNPTPTVSAATFSPAGGTYTSAQSVTITSATTGASIRYTLDGSTPTTSVGTLYAGPVTISASSTLKAIAYKSGSLPSAVTTATYTISTAPVGVTFYQNTVYGGTPSQLLAKGTYTMAQLAAKGVPNDWASSVKIPAGWTVIIYSDNNYGGTSWTLTSDTASFISLSPSANDQMSSCRIQ